AQRVSRRLVTRLATAGHRATDRAGERDLAALPARLDRIDAWIEEGLLGGSELNAADFQIAPNLALLLRFEDLARFVEGRPAARLAQRVAPDFPGQIPAVLPPEWLAPLRVAGSAQAEPGPVSSVDMTRATGYDDDRPGALPYQDTGALHSWRYGR
ncbi:MAG: hypothetical protein M3376_11320, partial [Actinomycetota bacterium]|nr:hypothetical protein [Actinomycetota bacterium]